MRPPRLALMAVVSLIAPAWLVAAEPGRKPNVVFILADDLGWGDIGCNGQTRIKTPNIDRLAADGMRFAQCYAGSTVCAPSRCALMTGLHTGHARVRGNGKTALAPDDATVAKLLRSAGYATAVIGKWGLGDPGTTGVPSKQGFDTFFGYLNHGHAHNYYPDHLWRHETKVPLRNVQSANRGVAKVREQYAPDLIRDEAIQFIADNKAKPFFLYYTPIQPHANNEKTKADGRGNEIASDAPYTSESWPQPEKDKAALITRLDADIGAVLAALKENGLEKDTLVIFSSDNGPHKEGGNGTEFFKSSGPFRGYKRSMTDGGTRVPGIARWPGVVKPGTVSDHVWAFWDFLPTACEVAGVPVPVGLDGLSILPTLTGKGHQKEHEYLYWEFHEGGTKQAIRIGNWKAIRLALGRPLELYDVVKDPGEATNVAADHPNVVAKAEAILKAARTESKDWPILPPKKKK